MEGLPASSKLKRPFGDRISLQNVAKSNVLRASAVTVHKTAKAAVLKVALRIGFGFGAEHYVFVGCTFYQLIFSSLALSQPTSPRKFIIVKPFRVMFIHSFYRLSVGRYRFKHFVSNRLQRLKRAGVCSIYVYAMCLKALIISLRKCYFVSKEKKKKTKQMFENRNIKDK